MSWYVEVDGRPKCESVAAALALESAEAWCKCQVRSWEVGYESVKRLATLMPESRVVLREGLCPERRKWEAYKWLVSEAEPEGEEEQA